MRYYERDKEFPRMSDTPDPTGLTRRNWLAAAGTLPLAAACVNAPPGEAQQAAAPVGPDFPALADGPIAGPGSGLLFPVPALPKAPQEETAIGFMAEAGDEGIAGIIRSEFFIGLGHDIELGDDLPRDECREAIGDFQEILGRGQEALVEM